MKNLILFSKSIAIIIMAMAFFAPASASAGSGNTLLILQVGAATDGNIQRSFVELYNNSDVAVNLNGYSLQYAEGTRETVAANRPNTATQDGAWGKIDLTGTIPPRHSFLILGDANLTGTTPMPNPALTFQNTAYGDMYVKGFFISNRSCKVALMSNTMLLTSAIQNPFDIDGKGTKAEGYVDMLGAMNTVGEDKINGYETNPVTDLNKQTGQRRRYFNDSDDNAADFMRAAYLGATTENFEKWRPKNLAFGAWDPITGLKDGETPVVKDPIIAGTPDALAGKLLILQAYGSSNSAPGASHSFVELYNATDATINLKGITLFYTDGTSAPTGMTNTNTKDEEWKSIPLNGTLPAKTSFLILSDRQNKTGRLQIANNYGDINDVNFILSNRAFKIALIRNKNKDLTVQNPFNMDGKGAKAQGYIDLVGSANEYSVDGSARDRIFGFEAAPTRNSASEAVRRHSLTDTDNNGADFESARYAAGGITDAQVEIFRPKNRVFGAWDPFTGVTKDVAKALPIVRIYTENELPITSKVDYTNITFSLTDPANPENNVFSNNPTDAMRGRGNATWNNPKKPYRIKFKENTSLFGQAAYKNWILLAEFRDPTFLTTPIAFKLGRDVFDYQPYTNTYQHVQLYLNGKYEGVYGLTEHRQASPDGVGVPGRVGVDPLEGWLIEMSIYPDVPMFNTNNYNIPIIIHTNNAPTGDPDDINNPYYDFIKKDWNKLCDLMASPAFPENGYRDLIDLNTVADFLLLYETVFNTDGPSLGNSLYFYKDKGGKICAGPVWDFEISFGWDWGVHNHIYFVPGTSTQLIPKNAFCQRFFDDPAFLVKYKEHWNQKYATLATFSNYIDSLGKKIRPAVLQDAERWDIPSGGYNYSTYDPDHARQVGMMIDWWNSRMPWLNTELNKVAVVPASKNFGTVILNNYFETSNQTFTLVSYGKMDNLTATLDKNNSSPFEISANLNQTATGNGGYLATITVRLKNGLSVAAYSDALTLTGTNQGKSFSLKASLNATISKAAGAEAPTPVLASKTLTSITLKPFATLNTGQSVEVAIGRTTDAPTTGWKQLSLMFNSLAPYTTYYVFARACENNNYYVGTPSAPLQVITDGVINSIETEQTNPLNAYVSNGVLHITGLTVGESVSVYNAVGTLVYHSSATGSEADISLNVKGVYIVKAGNRVVRVIFN